MRTDLSLVFSRESTDYRKTAQLAWGLTDEQMKGMHVHHHPPVSEGGRNIPEHLYVCSPSMHAHGWHSGGYFIEKATESGKQYGHLGGTVGGKCPWWTKDGEDVRSWECPGPGWERGRSLLSEVGSLPYWNDGKSNRRSLECPGPGWKPGLLEKWWTDGTNNLKTSECPGEGWRPGRSNLSANSQKWMCTVSGRVSTAGPLTIIQKSLGIDTSNRVKVE